MHVGVVGGGVVGIAAAYELRRRGAEVTVLERGEIGGAASKGNAGWVVPALAEPVNGPGLLGRLARMVVDPHSPLRVSTAPDPRLLRWVRAVLAESRPERYERNTIALRRIAADVHGTFDDFRDQLRTADGTSFGMREDGLLTVFLEERAAAEFWRDQTTLSRHGYDSEAELMDGSSARRLEPALSDAVAGAVHLRRERSVDPSSLVAALAGRLVATGGTILEHSPVRSMRRTGGGWILDTAGQAVSVDRVVVATGAWTNRLLAGLGVQVLMQPARGCSLTSTGYGTAPTRPLKLADAQIACSPLERGVRLSGTFDLVSDRAQLSKRRLRAVLRGARRYFRDWRAAPMGTNGWAGLRLATPDGLPVIGPVPGHDGLVVATGHGTLGVTLAPVTARAVAEIVTAGRVPEAFDVCRVERFEAPVPHPEARDDRRQDRGTN